MNIHEYQAKALLRSYGAPVSDGRVVLKAEDAKTAATSLSEAQRGRLSALLDTILPASPDGPAQAGGKQTPQDERPHLGSGMYL